MGLNCNLFIKYSILAFFVLFNTWFKYLKKVNSVLGLFKLGLYSLTFTIDSLKAALNTSQEGCIYKELLKSSCYIKVF